VGKNGGRDPSPSPAKRIEVRASAPLPYDDSLVDWIFIPEVIGGRIAKLTVSQDEIIAEMEQGATPLATLHYIYIVSAPIWPSGDALKPGMFVHRHFVRIERLLDLDPREIFEEHATLTNISFLSRLLPESRRRLRRNLVDADRRHRGQAAIAQATEPSEP
jgi:hypothetical protein